MPCNSPITLNPWGATAYGSAKYERSVLQMILSNRIIATLYVLFRFFRLIFSFRRKPLPYSLHHLTEPVEVQRTQCGVPYQIHPNKPHGQVPDCATGADILHNTRTVVALRTV